MSHKTIKTEQLDMAERSNAASAIIAIALKACVRPDAWAHGTIVAKVFAYQVKFPDPERLQVELLGVIEESNRRATMCPWVE